MVTWRAILLGVVLEVLIVFWIAQSEITARVFISSWCLVMPGIFVLLLTALYNRAMRGRPRWQLSQREQLTLYLMLAAGVLIPGYGFIQMLLPTMGTPFFYASPENQYARLQPHLPAWLFPRDTAALYGLFSGYADVPWGVWMVPLAAWGSLILAVCVLFLCTALLVSRQWIHAERLPFPINALPLEMTDDRPGFYRNSLMWIGFAIPAVLETLLALNYWFPSMPAVVLKHHDISSLITTRPWTGMNPMVFGLSPFVVGMAFVVPADISFSCWFFFLANRLLRVWAVSMGWDAPTMGSSLNRFPFPIEQTIGAFLVLAFVTLWRSRVDVRGAFAAAFRGRGGTAAVGAVGQVRKGAPEIGNRKSEIGNAVVFGWIASALFLVAFLTLAGMPFFLAVGILVVMLLFCVTLARVRAEAGPPWVFGPFRDVGSIWAMTLGTGNFQERSLAMLGAFRWFTSDIRFLTLPAQLDMLKLGDAARMDRRRMVFAMLLATVVAIVVGFYACLTISYQVGWGTAKVYAGPQWASKAFFNQSISWLSNPTLTDWPGIYWMAGGGAFTLLLMALRAQFLWWPFHPIGFVVANTGFPFSFWSHYMVAWALKVWVLRYGGMNLYRRVLPFFIGLILGDVATQTFWSAFASLLNIPVYQFVS